MASMRVGNVNLDLYLSEGYTLEAEVTEFEVEQGGNVTDNVRVKPFKFSAEAFVSNAPLDPDLAAARDNESAGDKSPSEFVYAQLEALVEAREPVTITTSLRSYSDMVLTSCTINRDKDTGEALSASLAFQQIRIVTNRRGVVRATQSLQQKGFKASGRAPIVQAYKDADGVTQERIVYVDKKGKATYGDGSLYEQKEGQTQTNATPQQIKLDKSRYGHPRPDQKKARAQGQPSTPKYGP